MGEGGGASPDDGIVQPDQILGGGALAGARGAPALPQALHQGEGAAGGVVQFLPLKARLTRQGR
eukprot:scaffold6398_cov51-Isochrysis_galbana.AAC.1